MAYYSQLKARTQLNSKLLQEFTAAIKQFAHQTLAMLPKNYIQKKAAYAFSDRVEDQEVKQHLLMGHNRILSESLNQALQLEAAKAAAEPPARL
jgi:lysophospholipid acyltransferase (LPLAT)-like uncharacterized protein